MKKIILGIILLFLLSGCGKTKDNYCESNPNDDECMKITESSTEENLDRLTGNELLERTILNHESLLSYEQSAVIKVKSSSINALYQSKMTLDISNSSEEKVKVQSSMQMDDYSYTNNIIITKNGNYLDYYIKNGLEWVLVKDQRIDQFIFTNTYIEYNEAYTSEIITDGIIEYEKFTFTIQDETSLNNFYRSYESLFSQSGLSLPMIQKNYLDFNIIYLINTTTHTIENISVDFTSLINNYFGVIYNLSENELYEEFTLEVSYNKFNDAEITLPDEFSKLDTNINYEELQQDFNYQFDIFSIDYNVDDALKNPLKNDIIVLDTDDKKLVIVDYINNETTEISFDYSPTCMYIQGDYLYVGVQTTGNSFNYGKIEKGLLKIYNLRTYDLEEQFEVDVDPYDLVVNKDGYVLISPASAQGSYIRIYNPEGGLVKEYVLTMNTHIYLNEIENIMYAYESWNFLTCSFVLESDATYINSYKAKNYIPNNDQQHQGFYPSPYGTLIYTGDGRILLSAPDKSIDASFIGTIQSSFNHIYFEDTGNYILAADNSLMINDYLTNIPISAISMGIKSLFVFSDEENIISINENNAGELFFTKHVKGVTCDDSDSLTSCSVNLTIKEFAKKQETLSIEKNQILHLVEGISSCSTDTCENYLDSSLMPKLANILESLSTNQDDFSDYRIYKYSSDVYEIIYKSISSDDYYSITVEYDKENNKLKEFYFNKVTKKINISTEELSVIMKNLILNYDKETCSNYFIGPAYNTCSTQNIVPYKLLDVMDANIEGNKISYNVTDFSTEYIYMIVSYEGTLVNVEGDYKFTDILVIDNSSYDNQGTVHELLNSIWRGFQYEDDVSSLCNGFLFTEEQEQMCNDINIKHKGMEVKIDYIFTGEEVTSVIITFDGLYDFVYTFDVDVKLLDTFELRLSLTLVEVIDPSKDFPNPAATRFMNWFLNGYRKTSITDYCNEGISSQNNELLLACENKSLEPFKSSDTRYVIAFTELIGDNTFRFIGRNDGNLEDNEIYEVEFVFEDNLWKIFNYEYSNSNRMPLSEAEFIVERLFRERMSLNPIDYCYYSTGNSINQIYEDCYSSVEYDNQKGNVYIYENITRKGDTNNFELKYFFENQFIKIKYVVDVTFREGLNGEYILVENNVSKTIVSDTEGTLLTKIEDKYKAYFTDLLDSNISDNDLYDKYINSNYGYYDFVKGRLEAQVNYKNVNFVDLRQKINFRYEIYYEIDCLITYKDDKTEMITVTGKILNDGDLHLFPIYESNSYHIGLEEAEQYFEDIIDGTSNSKLPTPSCTDLLTSEMCTIECSNSIEQFLGIEILSNLQVIFISDNVYEIRFTRDNFTKVLSKRTFRLVLENGTIKISDRLDL